MKILILFLILTSFLFSQNSYMLSFDGGDYATTLINDEVEPDGTGFISMWFVVDDITSTRILWSYTVNTLSTRYMGFNIQTDGDVRIFQRDAGGTDTVDSSDDIVIGTKYHLVVGSDGSDFLMWINGNSQSLTVTGGTNSGDWTDSVPRSANNMAWNIGVLKHSGGLSLQFNGDIDEFVYSNSTPTQAIVDLLYNNGTPNANILTASGAKIIYRLEDGSGQTVTDTQGLIDLTLGANSGASTDDPTWATSTFGWDAGTQTGFPSTKGFPKTGGFK